MVISGYQVTTLFLNVLLFLLYFYCSLAFLFPVLVQNWSSNGFFMSVDHYFWFLAIICHRVVFLIYLHLIIFAKCTGLEMCCLDYLWGTLIDVSTNIVEKGYRMAQFFPSYFRKVYGESAIWTVFVYTNKTYNTHDLWFNSIGTPFLAGI